MSAAAPKPNRLSGLVTLVCQLIDYGRHLAATLRSNPHPLGAGDIAQILARITRGLHRAEALEARLIRSAARRGAALIPALDRRGVAHGAGYGQPRCCDLPEVKKWNRR